MPCPSCGNINDVLVSSGHSNPANKGKKYFTCKKCKEFYWVENGVAVSPRGANPPKRTVAVDEFSDWCPPSKVSAPNDPPKSVDNNVWEAKDLRIARESALHTASRNNMGKQVAPAAIIDEANQYVHFIYNGLPEDVGVGDLG